MKQLSPLSFFSALLLCAPLASAQMEITTTFASNNGHTGNMFDVSVASDVTIHSFDINSSATTPITVDIYYKQGSYAGFETNPAAWTLGGTATVTPNGTDIATPVPVDIDLDVAAGEIWSFYITGSSFKYTNGTLEGAPFVSDSNLTIHEGLGCGAAWGSSFFTPRVWNGTIHYEGGPRLIMPPLLEGTLADFSLVSCEPDSLAVLAYSIAGGGPTTSPYGILGLSMPIKQLPGLYADTNGQATWSVTIPFGLVGLVVYVQGLERKWDGQQFIFTLTNSESGTIQ